MPNGSANHPRWCVLSSAYVRWIRANSGSFAPGDEHARKIHFCYLLSPEWSGGHYASTRQSIYGRIVIPTTCRPRGRNG